MHLCTKLLECSISVHLQYLIHLGSSSERQLLEPQIGPKGPRPLGGFGPPKKASKHHFSSFSISSRPATQKPVLTNHFHGFTGHGPGHHRLGSGHAETQQSKRPFSFAKSESFARQLAKTETQAFQASQQQKLMWNRVVKTSKPRLKSYVGSGSTHTVVRYTNLVKKSTCENRARGNWKTLKWLKMMSKSNFRTSKLESHEEYLIYRTYFVK